MAQDPRILMYNAAMGGWHDEDVRRGGGGGVVQDFKNYNYTRG